MRETSSSGPMPRRGASGSGTRSGGGPVLTGALGITTADGAYGSRHGSCLASPFHHGDRPSVTSMPPSVRGNVPGFPRIQDDTDRPDRSGIDGPVRAPQASLL